MLNTAAKADLTQRFGEAVSFSASVCVGYAQGVTALEKQPPDAVLKVTCTDQVRDAVRLCIQHKIPIIPFGAGTSIEGQINAPLGGLCLDFSGMNRILRVEQGDMYAVVEPGVTRKQLNNHLRDQGLTFPVDPGADATIGGMTATRASGTTTIQYGGMKQNALAAKVVTGTGTLINVGTPVPKSSSGFDLMSLMIGSEATLGVFTEVTVRLHPIFDSVIGGAAAFATVADAVDTVVHTRLEGLQIARLELLDEVSIRACNAYSGLDLPCTPHLFAEFHGTEAVTTAMAQRFTEIAAEYGADFVHSSDRQRREKLWQARHDAWWAAHALHPGKQGVSSDVCVPITRLPEIITAAQNTIRELALDAAIVGHVGDGNFHALLMHDPESAAEKDRVNRFLKWVGRKAIEMGGTCSGEHGIGQGKRDLMRLEHGQAVETMRAIKSALDPHGILNPGKLF